jgi:hypothetical protein
MCNVFLISRGAPEVHYEQNLNHLRFWIHLPSLHHADVSVKHDENGQAIINIEGKYKLVYILLFIFFLFAYFVNIYVY